MMEEYIPVIVHFSTTLYLKFSGSVVEMDYYCPEGVTTINFVDVQKYDIIINIARFISFLACISTLNN